MSVPAGRNPSVVVIRTGTANTASVLAGLSRAGAEPRLTSRAADIRDAGHVVLPGVGAFAAAMEALTTDDDLADAIRARVEDGRPTLCVCVGLQLLCESSEESPGVTGLGVVAGTARRFSGGVRVPQLGWNEVVPGEGCRLLTAGHAYFANSYRLVAAPAGWSAAMTDHGGPFVAAFERGAVVACQFHPELSGAWGLELLRRWLDEGGR